MKKAGLLFFISALLMFSCESKKEYTLTGKLPGEKYEGQMAYLLKERNMKSVLDSVKVTNGTFTFKGSADTIATRWISFDKEKGPVVFFTESGKIELAIDTAFASKLSGASLNQSFQSYKDGLQDMYKVGDEMYKKREEIKAKGEMTAEKSKELDKDDMDFMNKIENHISDFVKANASNAAGQYVFASDTYFLKPKKMLDLFPLIGSPFKDSDRFKKMEIRAKAANATWEGKQFSDVKGLTLDGKEDALSNYAGKGKVVLIDFWASWCGPCRAAFPEMKALYEKNKNKDFVIVGISLDDNKDNWEKATKSENIPWTQFSSLKGWDEPAALTYGVNGIPHLVLIDKSGVIVSRGIAGDALQYKIDELLK